MPLDFITDPDTGGTHRDWAEKIQASRDLLLVNGWRKSGWGRPGETMCWGKALLLAHGITENDPELLDIFLENLPVMPFILTTIREVTGVGFTSIVRFNDANGRDYPTNTNPALVFKVIDRCLEKLAALALAGPLVEQEPALPERATLPVVDPPDMFEPVVDLGYDAMLKRFGARSREIVGVVLVGVVNLAIAAGSIVNRIGGIV